MSNPLVRFFNSLRPSYKKKTKRRSSSVMDTSSDVADSDLSRTSSSSRTSDAAVTAAAATATAGKSCSPERKTEDLSGSVSFTSLSLKKPQLHSHPSVLSSNSVVLTVLHDKDLHPETTVIRNQPVEDEYSIPIDVRNGGQPSGLDDYSIPWDIRPDADANPSSATCPSGPPRLISLSPSSISCGMQSSGESTSDSSGAPPCLLNGSSKGHGNEWSSGSIHGVLSPLAADPSSENHGGSDVFIATDCSNKESVPMNAQVSPARHMAADLMGAESDPPARSPCERKSLTPPLHIRNVSGSSPGPVRCNTLPTSFKGNGRIPPMQIPAGLATRPLRLRTSTSISGHVGPELGTSDNLSHATSPAADSEGSTMATAETSPPSPHSLNNSSFAQLSLTTNSTPIDNRLQSSCHNDYEMPWEYRESQVQELTRQLSKDGSPGLTNSGRFPPHSLAVLPIDSSLSRSKPLPGLASNLQDRGNGVPNSSQMIQIHHNRLLSTFPWYHSKVTREEAEKLIEDSPSGTFLVRTSATSRDSYSLTFKANAITVHMKIVKDMGGRYILGEFSQPFDSVADIIDYYSTHHMVVKGVDRILLGSHIPKRQEGLAAWQLPSA